MAKRLGSPNDAFTPTLVTQADMPVQRRNVRDIILNGFHKMRQIYRLVGKTKRYWFPQVDVRLMQLRAYAMHPKHRQTHSQKKA